MAFKSHIGSNKASKGANKSSAAKSSQYGRVVHIILSVDDPKCKDASMINGVFYRIPGKGANEDTTEGLAFAYQGNVSMRVIPMEGEIVEIQSKPAAGEGAKAGIGSKYWTGIVPIWNHPHHNAAPDTKQPEWKGNLLAGTEEQATINPLQANPGDTVIEGRLGQSIRFGGNKGPVPGIIDDSNSEKPVIVISNGQIATTNGNDLIQEDVDKDFNSVYLVSDHKLPLTSINTKRDSYKSVPLTSDQYKGNQVVINGGRLYFNAKEESVFISAKNSIGLNADTLNFDATDYFCIDANKIYLGKKTLTATSSVIQPAVLGKQLETWLKSLLSTLRTVGTAMELAKTTDGKSITSLNVTGPILRAKADSLDKQYSIFKSNKVFIE
jgi:hypothetical protein